MQAISFEAWIAAAKKEYIVTTCQIKAISMMPLIKTWSIPVCLADPALQRCFTQTVA
jgi:hypothetical protein